MRKVCKPEVASTLSTAPTENEKANEIHGKRGSKQVGHKPGPKVSLSRFPTVVEKACERLVKRRQVLAEGLLARMHVSSS